MYNLHRIRASQLLCCFAVVLEMPAVWAGEKNIIHQRSLFKQFNVIVLWPPHRCLENRIYDFSNPTWGAVKLHCFSALFKTNGCGFSRGPIATHRFCFWCWVKSNSQQIECTICTESKLASSCAALLLCSRCQKHELGGKKHNPSKVAF